MRLLVRLCLQIGFAAGTVFAAVAGHAGEQGLHSYVLPAPGPRGTGKACYVGPEGKAGNPGTRESPWDIQSVFSGKQAIEPGSTVWLLAGTYKHANREAGSNGYILTGLKGQAEAPIQISAAAGARVTLDGGLLAKAPLEHVWIWDLEILVSENLPSLVSPLGAANGANPARPLGGLNLESCENCKFIDLVIHHASGNGITFNEAARDVEIHGCLIYEVGCDEGKKGNGISTKNRDGTKIIAGNIVHLRQAHGEFALNAYASDNGYVQNYTVRDNIFFQVGNPKRAPVNIGGGGAHTNHSIEVVRNVFYDLRGLELGRYTSAPNEDCHILNNWIIRGDIDIQRYKTAEVKGNVVIGGTVRTADVANLVNEENHIDPPKPAEGVARLYANQYDRSRAHVAILNWNKAETVTVDTAAFLKSGRVRVYDPLDYYTQLVGVVPCTGGKIVLPTGGKEFVVYVIAKEKGLWLPPDESFLKLKDLAESVRLGKDIGAVMTEVRKRLKGDDAAEAAEAKRIIEHVRTAFNAERDAARALAATNPLEAVRRAEALAETFAGHGGEKLARELAEEIRNAPGFAAEQAAGTEWESIQKTAAKLERSLAGEIEEEEVRRVSRAQIDDLIRKCEQLANRHAETKIAASARDLAERARTLLEEKKAYEAWLDIPKLEKKFKPYRGGYDLGDETFRKVNEDLINRILAECRDLAKKYPQTLGARKAEAMEKKYTDAAAGK